MPYHLIYDLFDGSNYGLYDSENGEHIAGIVAVQDATGEHYEGHAFNVPHLASRFGESLDEFAARLFELYTTAQAARWAAQHDPAELSLFA